MTITRTFAPLSEKITIGNCFNEGQRLSRACYFGRVARSRSACLMIFLQLRLLFLFPLLLSFSFPFSSSLVLAAATSRSRTLEIVYTLFVLLVVQRAPWKFECKI